MTEFFFTATEARNTRQRTQTVRDEIVAIQTAIFQSMRGGIYYNAAVGDNSPMTDSISFNGTFTIETPPNTGNYCYCPNHLLNTGDIVTVTSTGTLPSPLESGVFYYVVFLDKDHFNLSSTYSYSIQSRPYTIRITNSGSGTHTVRQYLNSRDYFAVWQGLTPSDKELIPAYTDRMNLVINYFTNLGYTIKRAANPSTNNTLMWKIQW